MTTKPVHRGELEVSRKAVAWGRPVCSPLNLYARGRILLCIMPARPRVQRAPGFPCALLLLSRVAIDAKLGRIAPRDREAVSADTRCLKIESADIYRARKVPPEMEGL